MIPVPQAEGHTLKTGSAPYICSCAQQFDYMHHFADHITLAIEMQKKMEPEVDSDTGKNFEGFVSLIRDCVDGQAKRKGYTANGADGDNQLYRFTQSIGASSGHSMGEIIYKATEYMSLPREVLLLKIAGWAYLEWKYGEYR